MEYKKTVSNPMLVGSIELMKADPSPEHKQMFIDEMMKGKFISPVIITPMPEEDENGKVKLTQENKVQFPMLTAPDGKNFFMAFTDMMEFKKWKKDGESQEDKPFFALTMDEFCAMTMRRDSVSMGAVINPFGANILVPREMMASLMAAKLAKMGIKPMPRPHEAQGGQPGQSAQGAQKAEEK